MALDSTQFLLDAQKAALQGEKFVAWGDFAKRRVGKKVDAAINIIKEREKKYQEQMVDLDSKVKNAQLLAKDNPVLIKALEDMKDDYANLRKDLTLTGEGSRRRIAANEKITGIKNSIKSLADQQSNYQDKVILYNEVKSSGNMSGAVSAIDIDEANAFYNPEGSYAFVDKDENSVYTIGRMFESTNFDGERIIKKVVGDKVFTYLDTKDFKDVDWRLDNDPDLNKEDFHKTIEGNSRYKLIDSDNVNKLSPIFEPSNSKELEYYDTITKTLQNSLKLEMNDDEIENEVYRAFQSLTDEKNLKGVDLQSFLSDFSNRGTGENYLEWAERTAKENKGVSMQTQWKAALDNLPQCKGVDGLNAEECRLERAKYRELWYTNTEVPENFTDADGRPINIVQEARKELSLFLSDTEWPSLKAQVEDEKTKTKITTGLSSGTRKGVNTSINAYVDNTLNKALSAPQNLVNASSDYHTVDPTGKKTALPKDHPASVGPNDIILSNFKETMEAIFPSEIGEVNLFVQHADSLIDLPINPDTEKPYNSLDELRLANPNNAEYMEQVANHVLKVSNENFRVYGGGEGKNALHVVNGVPKPVFDGNGMNVKIPEKISKGDVVFVAFGGKTDKVIYDYSVSVDDQDFAKKVTETPGMIYAVPVGDLENFRKAFADMASAHMTKQTEIALPPGLIAQYGNLIPGNLYGTPGTINNKGGIDLTGGQNN